MSGDQPKRSIFRANAWERYQRQNEKEVLPRLVGPRTLLFLWVLLAIIGISGVVAWVSRVPVYASGVSIITVDQNQNESEAVALVFLPPDQLSKVQPGQTVDFLRPGATGNYLSGPVEAVSSEILSPAEARRRYNLDGSAALVIAQPSAVVSVRLNQKISATLYQGSLLAARIEVGSQPVLTLLPVFEQLNGK